MKRQKRVISVTDKMASETRGESYYMHWAEQIAERVQQKLAESGRTCHCTKFGMPHRPEQCAEPRQLCTWDGKTGFCPGPCDCGS